MYVFVDSKNPALKKPEKKKPVVEKTNQIQEIQIEDIKAEIEKTRSVIEENEDDYMVQILERLLMEQILFLEELENEERVIA